MVGWGKTSWRKRCLSWRQVERRTADRNRALGQGHRPMTPVVTAQYTQECRWEKQGSDGLGSLTKGLAVEVSFWCCEDALEPAVQGGRHAALGFSRVEWHRIS